MTFFDLVHRRIEFELACHHVGDIGGCQRLFHPRQALCIGFESRLEHVCVDINILLPGIEVAIQVTQIPVILEAFLELVGCKLVQPVACFRPCRQFFEAPVPTGAFRGVIGNELGEKLTRLEAVVGSVQAVRFFVKRLDGIQVMVCRLAD